jgi:hypothetical protein
MSFIVLKVGWDEVERLLDKKEFAAALLVTAINVEDVLRDHLEQYKNNLPVSKVKDEHIRSMYGNIGELSLSGCYKVAVHLEKYGFALQNDWKNQISPLIDKRNKLVHVRGYFARLNNLKVFHEPVKQLITNAREFCEANPITRT